jgi:hypothetical protein
VFGKPIGAFDKVPTFGAVITVPCIASAQAIVGDYDQGVIGVYDVLQSFL